MNIALIKITYKNWVIITLSTIFLLNCRISIGQSNDSLKQNKFFHRYYEFTGALNYDLNNSVINGLTLSKGLQDVYTIGIRPCLNKKAGKILGSVWSFGVTYLSMIWPHEFGHALRANQVGGFFKIHNFGLPFPYTTMHLPQNATLEQNALSVVGGFEVNYLSARKIQNDYYEQGGLLNDELSQAFAHRIMYPIYAYIVIPQDPKKKETWIKTGGDPVHYSKPVWQMYSSNQVFNPDSTVNSSLVGFYHQSSLFATFWNFADPIFFKEIVALFGDVKEGKKATFIINNNKFKYTYGTMFNVSPLGYELYLNNYFKLSDILFVGSFKYGRPFHNNAIRIYSPNFFYSKKLKTGFDLELFDQDIYGKGYFAATELSFSISHRIDVKGCIGYKTAGYVIGKPLRQTFIGQFSVIINCKSSSLKK